MNPIAPHITAFLRERLICENTRAAYAYTFKLLFAFARKRLAVTPSNLNVEHIDATFVLDFLDFIQKERDNSASSRNTRLAAIRSFMRFLEYQVPSALYQIRRVLAIPAQRTDTRLVKYLSPTESLAILNVPNPKSRLGIRDRAMLYLGFTGGLRVSELVTLRLSDIRFEGRYVEIRVIGKGRRERVLLLWKEVGLAIRAWMAIRGEVACPELFLSATSQSMTRSGFEYVLNKHVEKASITCPSLVGKNVSPHTLRHTCAMNTLRATGDIRKVSLWLGHANQSTTEIYLQADPIEKIQALESGVPLKLRPGRFSPQDQLIASLMSENKKQKNNKKSESH